ncbi:HlyD family secretion protein [Pseudoalteromonas tunicata]|uniref:HlyD family secretion protein n=1 Tax=Pseudoalteromonas tunicata TaxID=314281 RepID=UPI00273FE277|nr:HlyD family efflux transporter periplasmic adaptor subunit [Pseudoalteromonas tunicata]MDP4982441.1 HlyD family efflux transporter periplasmic adaptor subunit [Pseudoalteromonas tunicata]
MTNNKKRGLMGNPRWMLAIVFAILAGCDKSSQVALGTLERDRVALTAMANEIIVALPVKQGQSVEKGAVLVQFDDAKQQAQLAQANAFLQQAQAKLNKLLNGARIEDIASSKAQVATAQANLKDAQQSYQRIQNLVKQSLSSQSLLDHNKANLDAAQGQFNQAQQQLNLLLNGARSEDIAIAQAQVAAQAAQVQSAMRSLADLTVKATRDGMVDSLPWNLGERVTQGSPVVVLLADAAPFARIYVPEPHRVHIKAGDSLAIHVDGIAETISGTVRWIASEAAFTPYYALNQQERSQLMYLAQVELPPQFAHLPSGVPVQVEMP